MRARKLPGAAALGLLASLLAHSAGYGGGHAMGGGYHDVLLAAASLAALTSLLALLSLAWAGAGRTLDGSILAARLRIALPSWQTVALSATLWFALVESVEPHHEAASPLLLFVALVAAAWVVCTLAAIVLRCVAGVVIAIRSQGFAPRSPWRSHLLLEAAPIPHGLLCARRRYARPPPIAFSCA